MYNGVKTFLFFGANKGFGWLSDFPSIFLGNTSDITADVSDVPIDGQYHKAKITIDGLSVNSDIDWLSKVQCHLTELELLYNRIIPPLTSTGMSYLSGGTHIFHQKA